MISYHGKMAGFFILSLPLHTLSLEAIHLNNKPSKPVWVSAVTFWGNCFPTEESYINSIVPQWMDGPIVLMNQGWHGLPGRIYDDVMTWKHITGHLWGESTGHWWIPLTKGQKCRALMYAWIHLWPKRWVASDLRSYDPGMISQMLFPHVTRFLTQKKNKIKNNYTVLTNQTYNATFILFK